MKNGLEVYDELTLRLGNIHAVADVIGDCDKEQADVNGAGYAICQMVKDIQELLSENTSLLIGDES